MQESNPYAEVDDGMQRIPLNHLDQLICIALARPDVAQQLLDEPQAALESVNDLVQLSPYERELLFSVQGAADLYDLAARLHELIQGAQADRQT